MDEIKEILSKAEYRDELDNGNVSISAALTVKQVQDMSAQLQALFDKRVEEIFEKFRNKPTQYHYLCWGSGFLGSPVLMIDKYGEDKYFRCEWAREDRSCSPILCPHKGKIKGFLELTPRERIENALIDRLVEALKSKIKEGG